MKDVTSHIIIKEHKNFHINISPSEEVNINNKNTLKVTQRLFQNGKSHFFVEEEDGRTRTDI